MMKQAAVIGSVVAAIATSASAALTVTQGGAFAIPVDSVAASATASGGAVLNSTALRWYLDRTSTIAVDPQIVDRGQTFRATVGGPLSHLGVQIAHNDIDPLLSSPPAEGIQVRLEVFPVTFPGTTPVLGGSLYSEITTLPTFPGAGAKNTLLRFTLGDAAPALTAGADYAWVLSMLDPLTNRGGTTSNPNQADWGALHLAINTNGALYANGQSFRYEPALGTDGSSRPLPDDGTRAFNFGADANDHAFFVVVPEPTSMGLIAIGAMGLLRRRR